ncbi:MAG: response regulator transcription factor [Magnetospirillum sp.]|nr:response regulator transcription factor [Magnetospirillum sp.]
MASLPLSTVRTLVVDQSPLIRQGVRMGLHSLGFREVMETGTIAGALAACREGVDMVILNYRVENNETAFVVREMRHGRLGRDPFVVVVMMLAAPNERQVRDAVDAGPDDLLLIPFAPDQLMARVRGVIEGRKKFVVTHDYIGPERRKAPRGNSAPVFEVPHPIRARAIGVPGERYQLLVKQTHDTMSKERTRRLAAAVEWEFRQIYATARDGASAAADMVARLFKVENICEELTRRLGQEGLDTANITAFSARCGRMKNTASRVEFLEIESAYNASRQIAQSFAEVGR